MDIRKTLEAIVAFEKLTEGRTVDDIVLDLDRPGFATAAEIAEDVALVARLEAEGWVFTDA